MQYFWQNAWLEGESIGVQSDGFLRLESVPIGEYDIQWSLETPDPSDYLIVSVESGQISIENNGQWSAITGQFAVQPNQNSEPLKLKVDELATFSFSPHDSYDFYLYEDAPTHPITRFTSLDELAFPMTMPRVPTERLGNVAITGTQIKLSTGDGDRAASSLGTFTTGDAAFLKSYGTEGSATKYSGLTPGVYSFDWSMYSKDTNGYDALYAWNGKQLIEIGRRDGASQLSTARWQHDWTTSSVEVLYDFVYVIALDENTTTGTTDFSLRNFAYSSALPYDPPVVIPLNPITWSVGDIKQTENELRVTTGTYDKAISTLSQQLTGERSTLSGYGIEGSLAMFEDLERGTYEITWQLYTAEDELDKDAVYLWNGEQMQLLAQRSQATNPVSSTRYATDWTTTQIELTNERLGLIALDTGDGSGTTELRISKIEKVAATPTPVADTSLDTTDIAILPSSPITYSGTVGGSDPGDAYQFETDDYTRAIAHLDVFGGDANLELWQLDPATGEPVELIASSHHLEYQSEQISQEIGSALYHFRVVPNGDEPIDYELTLSATAPTDPMMVDMGNSALTAWDMGTRYPEGFESDGIAWNHGVITGSDHSGVNTIRENIGGDDVTDFATFVIGQSAHLTLTTNGAITELLNSDASAVIARSDGFYDSRIDVFLQPGRYYAHYSSEGSIPQEFTSMLYLTP